MKPGLSVRLSIPIFLLALAGAPLCPGGPSAEGHGAVHARIALLTAELEEQPSAEKLLFRGELYRLHGELDEAERDYNEAERLDPGLARVHFCRAALALDRDRPAEALDAIDRFLRSDGEGGEALFLRAKALSELGRGADAAAVMEEAMPLLDRPTPEHYVWWADLVAGEEGETWREAIALLDRGIARLGPTAALENRAIDLAVAAGDYEEALRRIERIVERAPRKEFPLARKGEVCERAGREMEALAAFTEALAAIEALPPSRRKIPAIRDLEARLHSRLRDAAAEKEADPAPRLTVTSPGGKP